MNTKPNGTHNEHRSILVLESAGYACTRVVASLGIFDVIGTGPTDVVLVQCKTRDWPGSVEMEAIRNFQCPPLCKKIIHLCRDRARLPDVRYHWRSYARTRSWLTVLDLVDVFPECEQQAQSNRDAEY